MSKSKADMDGPWLMIACFWSGERDIDAVAEALRPFRTPEGKPRGAVAAFRHEAATQPGFERDLRRLDMTEVCANKAHEA